MKNKKRNPLEVLGEMQRVKRGVAVGSQLEGGSIKFGRTPEELNKKAAQLKKDAEKLNKDEKVAWDEGRERKSNRMANRARKKLTRAGRLETKAVKRGG